MNKKKYTIESSKDGTPTLTVINENGKKVYLHSRHSPIREAEINKGKFNPEKFDTIIALGSGLGYHLLELKEIIVKYKKVILIDVHLNIEEEIAKNPYTQFLTQSENVLFLCGFPLTEIEKKLEKLIDLDNTKGISVIEHAHSVRSFSNYYNNIRLIIEKNITQKAGNKATKSAFGSLYLKNVIKNLNLLSRYCPVRLFFNTMSDYPALVITSGPSLESYIADIYENQHRYVIIAVDSSLPVLISNNITPDFFISIDPQPYVNEHIMNAKLSHTIPVLSISSYPIYTEGFSLLSLNTHPFSQMIDEIFPDTVGSIDSHTGTVAGDALKLAHLFGFFAIGLIGFDFSFPNYKIYSRGTSYQKRFSLYFNNRFLPVETFNFNYIMKSSNGIKYNDLHTRRSFINYKELIEGYLYQKDKERFLNINSSGISMNGIRRILFKDFLHEFCNNRIDKHKMLENILSNSKCITETLSLIYLKDILAKEGVMSNLISASLEDNFCSNKLPHLKRMIQNALESL